MSYDNRNLDLLMYQCDKWVRWIQRQHAYLCLLEQCRQQFNRYSANSQHSLDYSSPCCFLRTSRASSLSDGTGTVRGQGTCSSCLLPVHPRTLFLSHSVTPSPGSGLIDSTSCETIKPDAGDSVYSDDVFQTASYPNQQTVWEGATGRRT